MPKKKKIFRTIIVIYFMIFEKSLQSLIESLESLAKGEKRVRSMEATQGIYPCKYKGFCSIA